MEKDREYLQPKFCFICGSKLYVCNPNWLQCENEECGEMYIPYIDSNDNQCLMHKWTPFSKKNN